MSELHTPYGTNDPLRLALHILCRGEHNMSQDDFALLGLPENTKSLVVLDKCAEIICREVRRGAPFIVPKEVTPLPPLVSRKGPGVAPSTPSGG